MRVALLIMTEQAPDQAVRAHLKVGATSLARHQLALVLALGCEKIICLAPIFDADLMELQHVAERSGATFHVITATRGLTALVSAADEVVTLAEGLLAWPQIAVSLLGAGAAVVVQPVEEGLEAGFERVDINHAAGGAMRLPGHLIEWLNQLPDDFDLFSALQRIALQAGVAQRMLPDQAVQSGRWTLVTDEAQAQAIEAVWIGLHSGNEAAGPSLALARHMVRLVGPAMLHAGSGSLVVNMAALAMLLLALVATWFGAGVLGFGICAVAWVVFLVSALLSRVERVLLGLPERTMDRLGLCAWTSDAVLAVLMTWDLALGHTTLTYGVSGYALGALLAGDGWMVRAFAPIMLLGLVRLVPPTLSWTWSRLLADRALLALFLGLATLFGSLDLVVAVGALSLLALGIGTKRRSADGQ